MSVKVIVTNRKAWHEYHILDKYEGGIVLYGSEVKAIREGKASIKEAYVRFIDNELFVKNLHIAEYSNGGQNNHEPKRARKLLLNRQELNKMIGKVKEKGMSIIPIRLFINEKGKAKLEIALAKGKKIYDKRESIKEKDQKRDIAREQSSRK